MSKDVTFKMGPSKPSKMFIARKIMNKSWWYHISRYQIIQHFKFLKSDTPYYFSYISASRFCAKMPTHAIYGLVGAWADLVNIEYLTRFEMF